MWDALASSLVTVACTPFGKWTIQALVESMTSPEETLAVQKTLTDDVVFVMFEERDGAHIITSLVNSVGPEGKQYIYEAAVKNILGIARHKYGCATLQRCLETGSQEQIYLLATALAEHSEKLVLDNHGNYIMQHVMSLPDEEIKRKVFEQLTGKFVDLAMHKFGSNVVEKCLRESTELGEGYHKTIMAEFMEEGALEKLLVDPFGNYVVQHILSSCGSNSEAWERVRDRIRSFHHSGSEWGNSVAGRRILQKIGHKVPGRKKGGQGGSGGGGRGRPGRRGGKRGGGGGMRNMMAPGFDPNASGFPPQHGFDPGVAAPMAMNTQMYHEQQQMWLPGGGDVGGWASPNNEEVAQPPPEQLKMATPIDNVMEGQPPLEQLEIDEITKQIENLEGKISQQQSKSVQGSQ